MRRLAIVGFLLVASPALASTGAHRHGVQVGACLPFDRGSVTMCDVNEEVVCVRDKYVDALTGQGWDLGPCLIPPNTTVCCVNNSPIFGEYVNQEDNSCAYCHDPYFTGVCDLNSYASGDGLKCILNSP